MNRRDFLKFGALLLGVLALPKAQAVEDAPAPVAEEPQRANDEELLELTEKAATGSPFQSVEDVSTKRVTLKVIKLPLDAQYSTSAWMLKTDA